MQKAAINQVAAFFIYKNFVNFCLCHRLNMCQCISCISKPCNHFSHLRKRQLISLMIPDGQDANFPHPRHQKTFRRNAPVIGRSASIPFLLSLHDNASLLFYNRKYYLNLRFPHSFRNLLFAYVRPKGRSIASKCFFSY